MKEKLSATKTMTKAVIQELLDLKKNCMKLIWLLASSVHVLWGYSTANNWKLADREMKIE